MEPKNRRHLDHKLDTSRWGWQIKHTLIKYIILKLFDVICTLVLQAVENMSHVYVAITESIRNLLRFENFLMSHIWWCRLFNKYSTSKRWIWYERKSTRRVTHLISYERKQDNCCANCFCASLLRTQIDMHVMHRARALSTKMNNDRADGHCYSFDWI